MECDACDATEAAASPLTVLQATRNDADAAMVHYTVYSVQCTVHSLQYRIPDGLQGAACCVPSCRSQSRCLASHVDNVITNDGHPVDFADIWVVYRTKGFSSQDTSSTGFECHSPDINFVPWSMHVEK